MRTSDMCPLQVELWRLWLRARIRRTTVRTAPHGSPAEEPPYADGQRSTAHRNMASLAKRGRSNAPTPCMVHIKRMC